jgi:hypothetical protein
MRHELTSLESTGHETVFLKNMGFEFPQEVLTQLRLRPNQKISRRQLWNALSAHAKFLLAMEANS